jgi:hypothetical protein
MQHDRNTHLSQRPLLWSAAVLIGLCAAGSSASQTIFRCPSINGVTQYTNDAAEAQRQRCEPMTGGNLTVVQTRPAVAAAPGAAAPSTGTQPVRLAAASPAAGVPRPADQRVNPSEQRQRDADARTILEGELRKEEAALAELRRDFNNGEPERRGDERNYQRYLDRVAAMREQIARKEGDIAAIRRELQKFSASN